MPEVPTVEDYIAALPDERSEVITRIREVVLKHLPKGFKEVIAYGMIGYVVPHSLFPKGYHCNPKLPLPFMNIASQKNFIALHHLGIYSSKELLDWFVAEYPKYSKTKLDMGKGCIRFKKMDAIPYDLIGALAAKMTVADWVSTYEAQLNNR